MNAAARVRPGEGGAAADDRARQLAEIDRLATWLDSRWRIPGTSWRFGLDAVAGLVPGLGDAAGGLVSAFLILRARQLGLPTHVLVRMIGNVAIDTLVGSVPLLGSVFDVAFKANRRNVRLLRNHLQGEILPPERR
ncbi:DUF4112 domain-containing protein [Methylobrevis albus]|uniref:DUF4112 domain-containing protein n=1 Tax=Methylobrevis albus TaxID=2793297 RepID=A0A931I179_9HYPH|nr:DUF4112 domain-containing protein [Methylobrevis albus]MBH0237494.1 DUF4112 domain-containing protein [Methylobrevis albus]